MMNDAFLNDLVADLKPVKPMKPRTGWLLLAGAVAVSASLVIGVLGMRIDLAAVLMTAPFLWKMMTFLALGLVAAAVAIRLSHPNAGQDKLAPWFVPGLAVVLLLPAVASLFGTGDQPLISRLDLAQAKWCFSCIIAASLAPMACLTVWLRRGAPVRPVRAAVLIGLASGGLGAAAFALHCPHSDPLYVALWYGLSVALVVGLARVLLPRWLRW
jgi:hypothetical protein